MDKPDTSPAQSTLTVTVAAPVAYRVEQYQDEAAEALDLIIRLRRARVPHSEIMRRLGGAVPRELWEAA